MLVQRTGLVAGLTVMLLIAGMVGASQVWASEAGSTVGHINSFPEVNGVALTDDELAEIDGEGLQVAALIVLTYVTEKALEYAGVDEWLMETAFPAIENAAVSAYEAAKDVVTSSFEYIGEAALNNPYTLTYY